MRKKILARIVLLLLIVFITYDISYASEFVEIDVYGKGCLSCFIDYVNSFNSSINDSIKLNIYYIEDNIVYENKLQNIYEVNSIPIEMRGVIAVVIDNRYIFINYVPIDIILDFINNHFDDYNKLAVYWDELSLTYKIFNGEKVSECNQTVSVWDCRGGFIEKDFVGNISIVLISGLLDGINPCAFAVLFFFIALILNSALLGSDSEAGRRVLMIGGVYILGVYLSYITIGITLYRLISWLPYTREIAAAGAFTLILLGLVNIRDVFSENKPFLSLGESQWQTIRGWMRVLSIPSSLVAGVLVGLFEFPCTGGIYLSIISLLASRPRFIQGLLYLFIYNFAFVAPLIAILIFMSSRMVSFSIEEWKRRKEGYFRVIMGLVFIFLGVYIILTQFR